MIDCRDYISEWKACDENPGMTMVDVEYCETVDHTGRPIGEYGACLPNPEIKLSQYDILAPTAYVATQIIIPINIAIVFDVTVNCLKVLS